MCSRAVVIFALKAVTSVTIDRVLAWILATLSAPASLTGHRAFEYSAYDSFLERLWWYLVEF